MDTEPKPSFSHLMTAEDVRENNLMITLTEALVARPTEEEATFGLLHAVIDSNPAGHRPEFSDALGVLHEIWAEHDGNPTREGLVESLLPRVRQVGPARLAAVYLAYAIEKSYSRQSEFSESERLALDQLAEWRCEEAAITRDRLAAVR